MNGIFTITEPAQGCGVYALACCNCLLLCNIAALLGAYLYPWNETTTRRAVSYNRVIIAVGWDFRERDFIDEFSISFLFLYKIQGCQKNTIGNSFDGSGVQECNIGGGSYFTGAYNYYSRDLILLSPRLPTRTDTGVSSVVDGRTPLNMAENGGLRSLSSTFTVGYEPDLCFWRSVWTLFVCPDSRPWDALSVTGDTPGYARSGAKSGPGTESGQFVAITGDEHLDGCR